MLSVSDLVQMCVLSVVVFRLIKHNMALYAVGLLKYTNHIVVSTYPHERILTLEDYSKLEASQYTNLSGELEAVFCQTI